MLGRLFKRGFNLLSYARLHVRDVAAGRKLALQQDNLRLIGAGDIILFSRMGDANHPMSFFTDYYRKLGVRHFMFINMNPSDDLPDWSRESDITIWKAAQAENSGFNIYWVNDLLRRYGTGRWNLVVEPGEYFIYAKMETRSLKALVSFLEEDRRQTMHAIVLDAYGDASPGKCDQSASPFETWPLFDRDGYIQSPGLENSTIIRGGPRMRLEHRGQPRQSPNLARIPLVKWKRHFHYKPSGAAALPRLLNRAHSPGYISPSGALMSFNWISDRQRENASEFPHGEIVQESLSVPYAGFRQLQDLGLISPGRWF